MYEGVDDDYDDDDDDDDESTVAIFLCDRCVCCCCCDTEWTRGRLQRPHVSSTMVFCSLCTSQAVNVAGISVLRLTASAQAL